MPSTPLRPTTLEIDLDAAADNLRAVRDLVGPSRKIFAVVKADGYGYGAAEMGAVFARNGADCLGVADVTEGIRLRQRGIATPILVYPNSLPSAAAETLAHGLVPTLVDLDGRARVRRGRDRPVRGVRQGGRRSRAARRARGAGGEDGARDARAAAPPPGRAVRPSARRGRRRSGVRRLAARPVHRRSWTSWRRAGVRVPVRLLAASPFVLRFPHTYLNAVDPGRMLYGITFPGETPPVPLRPALRALTTRVIALKELAPRERFAEQAPFPVTAPLRLGVIPMGSADGLRWLHAGRVLVRGRAVPLIGSPSLEHTRIDLTVRPRRRGGRRGRDHRPPGRSRDHAGRGRRPARPRAPPRGDDGRPARRPRLSLRGTPGADAPLRG